MPGDCQFNDSWTLGNEYAHWISRTRDVHKTRCMLSLEIHPCKLMSESLKVLEKFVNFIFKNEWEPCNLSVQKCFENVRMKSQNGTPHICRECKMCVLGSYCVTWIFHS